jgi:lauroyl/myristoyl acyltransferase
MKVRLFQFLTWLIPRVPLKITHRLTEVLADLAWLLARETRAGIERNQRAAAGEGVSRREIALRSRRVLRNLLKTYVDEFRLPALSPQAILDTVVFHGLEHLNEALSAGRGAILVGAHFGAPHLTGHALSVLGYRIVTVVEHVQPEELFQFLCQIRSSHGVQLIPVDRPLIGLIRTLRRDNGIVGLAADRNTTGTGALVSLFGLDTMLPDGPARLAIRTGAPLLSDYSRRVDDTRYEVVVESPIPLPELPGDAEAAVREGTARVAGRLEVIIRRAPEQWVMTVPLWH